MIGEAVNKFFFFTRLWLTRKQTCSWLLGSPGLQRRHVFAFSDLRGRSTDALPLCFEESVFEVCNGFIDSVSRYGDISHSNEAEMKELIDFDSVPELSMKYTPVNELCVSRARGEVTALQGCLWEKYIYNLSSVVPFRAVPLTTLLDFSPTHLFFFVRFSITDHVKA